MNTTFRITKKDFKIWRYLVTGYLLACLGCFWLLFVPFGVPALYYLEFVGGDTKMIAQIVSECPRFFIAILIAGFPIPLLIAAFCAKARLPSTIKFDRTLVFNGKKGKQWKVPYSKCRFTTAFVRQLISNGLFRGIWFRGITIYVPGKFLQGMSESTDRAGNRAPADMVFYILIKSKDIPEMVAFLERKCGRLPSPTLGQLLTFVFAPSLFVWGHFAITLPLINQIGNYGVIGSMGIGIISGIFLATSAVAKPYRKIEYVQRKWFITLNLCGMVAVSVGLPFYLWCNPSSTSGLQPTVLGAFFVVFLCFVEAYFWRYCLLKGEF